MTVRLTCDHSDVRHKENNIKKGEKKERTENVTHDDKLSDVKASRATKLSPARIGLRARADVIHSMVNVAPHVSKGFVIHSVGASVTKVPQFYLWNIDSDAMRY